MQTLIFTAIVLMVANLLLAYFIYRKISKKLNTMHQILDVAMQEIDEIKRTPQSGLNLFDSDYDGSIEDSLYEEAKKIVAESGKASASFLQRRLRVGYARAARLLDMLEEKGIIGPAIGVEPREVLITK